MEANDGCECAATAADHASDSPLTWTGDSWTSITRSTGERLRLQKLSKADVGKYACEATNGVGAELFAQFQVKIRCSNSRSLSFSLVASLADCDFLAQVARRLASDGESFAHRQTEREREMRASPESLDSSLETQSWLLDSAFASRLSL